MGKISKGKNTTVLRTGLANERPNDGLPWLGQTGAKNDLSGPNSRRLIYPQNPSSIIGKV